MLWGVHWGGYCVSRWIPETGECLERIELPVSQVTSCCFGGEHLDELFITSASVGLSEVQLLLEPLTGSVFKSRKKEMLSVNPRVFLFPWCAQYGYKQVKRNKCRHVSHSIFFNG